MNLFVLSFATLASFVAIANGASMIRQEAETGDSCNLTGTYQVGTDISSCSKITVGPLTVPAGVTLDLNRAKNGATINFVGVTTFGTKSWPGPLVTLSGNSLKVMGTGTLDGQGLWYWKQGTSIVRPVFFNVQSVIGSTISGFTIKNSPYRTFSIFTSQHTTLSGLTLDSTAGNGLAKNTDGFDMSLNEHVTITGNHIYNQDDCLAMQSSINTTFSGNTCSGGHGISIGSLGGKVVDETTTVSGLYAEGNIIINSDNGLRIKTVTDTGMDNGVVTNVKYIKNVLKNVRNAIAIHADYSRPLGAYNGIADSLVTISDVTVDGLTGSVGQKYDIVLNPRVVSKWTFSNIKLSAPEGTCRGQPTGICLNAALNV
ncbi:unnamed protein product [Peronospora effusa]|nr:unnamed protein product [Peronospora effusa]